MAEGIAAVQAERSEISTGDGGLAGQKCEFAAAAQLAANDAQRLAVERTAATTGPRI